MKLDAFYTAIGGNYEEVVSRFPREDRILRYLRMLPADGSMELLAAAMRTQDAETAFRAAHTLKGVALNLGLTDLAEAAAAMTEALRGRTALPAETPALYKAVADAYARFEAALGALEE